MWKLNPRPFSMWFIGLFMNPVGYIHKLISNEIKINNQNKFDKIIRIGRIMNSCYFLENEMQTPLPQTPPSL